MFDIDKFKEVNERYGHEVGDVVLKQIGDVITESMRAADVVIRWGGEEFLALLNDTDESGLLAIAERARQAVEDLEIHAEGHELHKTISIGAAIFPTDTCDFGECINHADIAMYQAKVRGRNHVVRHRPEPGPAPDAADGQGDPDEAAPPAEEKEQPRAEAQG